MAILKRSIKIEWKINPSYFSIVNQKIVNRQYKRIGSAVTSVNRMLAKDEMMRVLMPTILGIDPTSHTSNWSKDLADWWHSLSVEVPENGLELDTSLRFDLKPGNEIRAKYVSDFISKNKDIDSDEKLMNALMDKKGKGVMSEDEIYRYAEPVNPYQYLIWYYCKGYRSVSNDLNAINKSSNIEFFMYDEEIKIAAKRKIGNNAIEATELYVELAKDKSKLRDILCLLRPDAIRDILKLSDEDVRLDVHGLLLSKSEDFIQLAKDKDFSIRADIEKYIAVNILKRLPDSKIIVDASEQTKLIGHSIQEAIVYFTTDSPENKKYLSELSLRYKQIVK